MHTSAAVARYAVALAPVFAALAGAAEDVTLVTDLSPEPAINSADPANFVTVGQRTFFTAIGKGIGRELWVSDGTAAGTILLADIHPGMGESDISDMQAFGETLLFFANDDSHGLELWQSDGTRDGTVMLADLQPGPRDGVNDNTLAIMGSSAYFSGDDGHSGFELWRFDGAGRLQQVADIAPDADSNPTYLTPIDDRLFFVASRTESGIREPFVSDGTAAGTLNLNGAGRPVADLDRARFFVPIGDTVVFGANRAQGSQLWHTDGTPQGTQLLRRVSDTPSAFPPSKMFGTGERVLFLADAPSGRQWFVTDGTAQGTRPLLTADDGLSWPSINELVQIADSLYFRGSRGSGGEILWSTDTRFTSLVPLVSVDGEFAQSPRHLTVINGSLFFVNRTESNALALWRVADGKQPELVRDITPSDHPFLQVAIGGTGHSVLFGGANGTDGVELWRSDGTPTGTALLINLWPESTASTRYGQLLAYDNVALFVGPGTELNAWALWRTNELTSATSIVRSFPVADRDSHDDEPPTVRGLIPLRERVVFQTSIRGGPSGQWITDGTTAGTEQISEVSMFERVGVGDKLIGMARDSEIHVSDGSKGSLRQISDIVPGPGFPYAYDPQAFAGHAFFIANDQLQGEAVWRTDGTVGGTHSVFDANPGPASALPILLGSSDNGQYFRTQRPGPQRRLWRIDHAGAVQLVADIGSPPPYLIMDMNSASLGDKLFFQLNENERDVQLWVTDGSEQGTRPLAPIASATRHPWSARILEWQGHIYFVGEDVVNGRELWRTNGTVEGTSQVADIDPGSGSSRPADFTVHDGALFFTARTRAAGREIFRTNGVDVVQVTELQPGSASGAPEKLTSVGDALVFVADDGVHGRELWSLSMSTHSYPTRQGYRPE